jgi:carboxylesterase type B
MQGEETVSVGVAQGELQGRKTVTASGTTYYSFKGIPYAKPPLGSLRFRVSTHTQGKTQTINFML